MKKSKVTNAPNTEVQSEAYMMANMFYNNVDPRRKQELSDARMIQEDQNSIGNLPRQAIHHTFNAWEYPERLAMYNQSQPAKR